MDTQLAILSVQWDTSPRGGGASLVLYEHSQMAILTVQWDTSPWGIVGAVWTLTAGMAILYNTFPVRSTVRASCANINGFLRCKCWKYSVGSSLSMSNGY